MVSDCFFHFQYLMYWEELYKWSCGKKMPIREVSRPKRGCTLKQLSSCSKQHWVTGHCGGPFFPGRSHISEEALGIWQATVGRKLSRRAEELAVLVNPVFFITSCYGSNVSPRNSCVGNLIPSATVLEGGVQYKVFRSGGFPLPVWINVNYKSAWHCEFSVFPSHPFLPFCLVPWDDTAQRFSTDANPSILNWLASSTVKK